MSRSHLDVLGVCLIWTASLACMLWRTIDVTSSPQDDGSMVWGTWGIYLGAVAAILTGALLIRRERLRAADIAAIAIERAEARANVTRIGGR